MDKEGYGEKCQKAFEIAFEKNVKINKSRSLDCLNVKTMRNVSPLQTWCCGKES